MIIDKYFNYCPSHYELLSLINFSSFYSIKKKTSKHHTPKIIKFVNYNRYEGIENWLREQILLCTPFRNSKNSQLGISVTWHDAFVTNTMRILRLDLFSTTKCHI